MTVASHPPVISLRQLRKSYDSLEVLKGVDLEAREGDVISLIGSSGSGKSTMLRCINMLEISQAGEIEFCGDPVRWTGNGTDRVPADRQQVIEMRTRLSMVFQQFNLWSHMTVLKNVVEAPITVLGRPRSEVVDEAMGLLAKVGIADKANSFPAQLSGGQQQMLALAMTLIQEPEVWLIDELSLGLAPVIVQELLGVIEQLKADGQAMVIVEQSLNVALAFADRAVFMEKGQVRFSGPAQELAERGDLARAVFLGGEGG